MTEKANRKERIHLTMGKRTAKRLESLKEKTEAGTYAEVLKNALRLYDALMEEEEKGRKFYVKDPETGELISYKIFI